MSDHAHLPWAPQNNRSSEGHVYMIKRNTSLNRVEGLAEAFSQAPVSRRRSPVTKLVQQQQQQQALNDTPPCSPKRGRSPSPSSRRPGGSSRGRQDWPRGGSTRVSGRAAYWGMFLPRPQQARDGGGAQQGGGGESVEQHPAGKGPKSLFRFRAVPFRKVAASVAVGLCVVAGGRRLSGYSSSREEARSTERRVSSPPNLRGGTRARGVGEIIRSGETLYCSAPLDYPSAQRPLLRDGAEDVAGAAAKGLELRQLQVTIRHGDRSAIHDLPNAEERKWRCQPFSEEIQRKWEGVSRFSVQSVDGKPLERSFTPAVYAEEEMDQLGDEFEGQAGELCKHGQLTEAGIRQHLTLGDHMHKAYRSLLGDVAAEQIYIRSTDYTRTLESAAAFLMSFFPGSSGMSIITNEDQENEVMHGIGSKAISENTGGQGPEKTTVGTCERAAMLSEQQFLAFKPRPDVVAELQGLFGEEVSELKMTSMADQMHALSCHNMTLPCSDKGCVSPEVAMDVMVEADRQMCLRYYGADGGGESAALSLYPFTTEILTNMKRALSGDSPTKFALFSGHDTVVAPLLAAFGAYDCRWPPYASHVAFELWSKPPAGQGDKDPPKRGLLGGGENVSGGEDAASRRALAEEGNDAPAGGEGAAEQGGGSAESGAGSPNNPSQEGIPPAGDAQEDASDAGVAGGKEEEEAYVRVTFQGNPITHHITDCGPFEGPYGREFCPLSLFARTIARALGPHETLEEACRDLDTRY